MLWCWFVVVCVCVGVVHSQCNNQTTAVQYHNAGAVCNQSATVDGTVIALCKNFLACRTTSGDGVDDAHCEASDEEVNADFPYGLHCTTHADCLRPQICGNERTCDYNDMINGYRCVKNSQCDSDVCLNGTCSIAGSDGFSDGLGCRDSTDCHAGTFCDVNGECVPSLGSGKSCNEYSDVSIANYVCEPGYACLPKDANTNFTCTKLFSAPVGTYCGQSSYKCEYGLYCNHEQKCAYYPSYEDSIRCDSSDSSVCPNGYRCSCEGSVGASHSTCQAFVNPFCPKSLDVYLDCLSQNRCPFDPYTIINNPNGAVPIEFVGPLNRFSCAAQHCTTEYNKFVRCQNDGFESDDLFSPALIPQWCLVGDVILAGWQIALIVIGSLALAAVFVAIILLLKDKQSYEEV